MNVYAWIRRVPQPAKLRVDGKKTIAVTNGKGRWKDAFDAVMAEEPSKLEALNDAGDVLRTCALEGDDQDDEKKPAAKEGRSSSELVELATQIATIVMEAGDKGAQRHAEAFQTGFDHLSGLVQMLCERLSGVEAAWQQTLSVLAEVKANGGGEGEQDVAGQAVAQLIGNALSRPAPRVVKGGK